MAHLLKTDDFAISSPSRFSTDEAIPGKRNLLDWRLKFALITLKCTGRWRTVQKRMCGRGPEEKDMNKKGKEPRALTPTDTHRKTHQSLYVHACCVTEYSYTK